MSLAPFTSYTLINKVSRFMGVKNFSFIFISDLVIGKSWSEIHNFFKMYLDSYISTLPNCKIVLFFLFIWQEDRCLCKHAQNCCISMFVVLTGWCDLFNKQRYFYLTWHTIRDNRLCVVKGCGRLIPSKRVQCFLKISI